MKNKVKILRSYQYQKDGDLGNTALHVSDKMTGNVNFTKPAVDPALLKTSAQEFNEAVGVSKDGTTQDTLHKNALKKALIAMLDTEADYVESNSNNNPETMDSSGFTLASLTPVYPAPVGNVTITGVTNPASGSLNLGMDYGPNVWGFEVQVSTDGGKTWLPAGYFTDPADVTPTGLTPGVMYAIRVRLHGSSNQVSDWSDVVNHMAM
jgi:hypothetical protein